MKKGLFANYKFFAPDGSVRLTEEGVEDIRDLADIVIAKHFYLNSEIEKEDLKSIGVLKVLDLLRSGSFDPTRSSLKNYCYTGMRNEMKNYLYRGEREFVVDDEILATNVDSVTSTSIFDNSDSLYHISRSEVKRFVGRMPYEEQLVVNALTELGFVVEGGCCKVDQIECKERTAIIQCLVIWYHLEHYRY